MSKLPPGSGGVEGITSMMFREIGQFWEQAWKWAEERAAEDRVNEKTDAERRRLEAEAHFLEQARLAKQAGLDVDAILAKVRDEPPRLTTPPTPPTKTR